MDTVSVSMPEIFVTEKKSARLDKTFATSLEPIGWSSTCLLVAARSYFNFLQLPPIRFHAVSTWSAVFLESTRLYSLPRSEYTIKVYIVNVYSPPPSACGICSFSRQIVCYCRILLNFDSGKVENKTNTPRRRSRATKVPHECPYILAGWCRQNLFSDAGFNTSNENAKFKLQLLSHLAHTTSKLLREKSERI